MDGITIDRPQAAKLLLGDHAGQVGFEYLPFALPGLGRKIARIGWLDSARFHHTDTGLIE